ncbi:MAG: DUF3365 domain-containing protein [Flavobacteriales bacterium]
MKHILIFSLIGITSLVLSCSSPEIKSNEQSLPENALSVLDTAHYIHQADSLITITFDTLSKTLKAKMNEGGPAAAVPFCREQAYPLTATYQNEFVFLRRTSLKFRNPGNTPSDDEKAILEDWQKAFDAGNTPGYGFYTDEGRVHVMKPIFLKEMCLACHGTLDKDINTSTLAVIDSLYSLDKARNYKEGDLRGGWHVTFFVQD